MTRDHNLHPFGVGNNGRLVVVAVAVVEVVEVVVVKSSVSHN